MLIQRDTQLQWLDRSARLSPALLVLGLRGVGKTKLVQSWLDGRQQAFAWYSLGRFAQLSAVLGFPERSIEAALDSAAQNWKSSRCSVVVWDDLHLLSTDVLNALLSFVRFSPSPPVHVFVSDQELPEFHSVDLELATLKLLPFLGDQARSYGEALGGRPFPDDEAARFEKETGGLPLLMNLWVSAPEAATSFQKRILGKLSPSETEVLHLAATLGRAFHPERFEAVSPGASEAAHSLHRKFLLDSVPGAPGQSVIPGYVQSLLLKERSEADAREAEKRVLQIIAGEPTCEALELLIHALRARQTEVISPTALKVLPERFERLHSDDLTELEALLAGNIPELTSDASVRLFRLRLRALFLLGRRKEAVEFLRSLPLIQNRSSGATAGNLHRERQAFLLEAVQAFNRSGEFAEARALADSVRERMEEPFAVQLEIEIAAGLMNHAPAEADPLLRACLQTLENNPDFPERDAVLATAAFQHARCMNALGDFRRADQYYAISATHFSRVERPYFTAVSLLNRAWLALNAGNWAALESVRAELHPLIERFSYRYVKAGLLIIEATTARLGLEPARALHRIEQAQTLLGQSVPVAAQLDTLTEKTQVLLQLGFRSKALESFRAAEGLCGASGSASGFRSRISALRLLLQAALMSSEELLDRWEKLAPSLDKEDREALQNMLLQRGLVSPEAADFGSRRACASTQAAQLEATLLLALKEDRKADAWRLVSRLEKLLSVNPDPLPERIALGLLQTELLRSDGSDQTGLGLERVEMELLRWNPDPEIKAPLEAWFSVARAGAGSIRQHPGWSKALPGDRERWQGWWGSLYPESRKGYLVITPTGRTEVETPPVASLGPAAKKSGLFIVAHLAEITFNGKPVREFLRRHSLRRLLEVLVESSPGFADKPSIAGLVWGEDYSPALHDARIYTSIQRLRTMLGKSDAVQNWETGYRWNPAYAFCLVRPQSSAGSAESRCAGLILQTLEKFSKTGQPWLSRSRLVEITGDSEATVKRQLARLLSEGRILRQGNGRAVTYKFSK